MKPRNRLNKALHQNSDAASRNIESLPVRRVADIEVNQSIVFYGKSGTGKTTLAGSCPGDILYLDIRDRGTDSISDVEGVDVMEVETWDDIETVYWYLKAHPDKYETVVIDTITQLQNIAIEKVINFQKGDSDKNLGDWGTMTKRAWGDVASLMKVWITNFRDLPMVSVFLAQERLFNVDEDKDGDENAAAPEIGPQVSPSVAKHLNASVSIIGNTFIRQKVKVKKGEGGKPDKELTVTQYCLRVGPNPLYVTKIRKPRGITPPDILVDPTYESIIEIIKGE